VNDILVKRGWQVLICLLVCYWVQRI